MDAFGEHLNAIVCGKKYPNGLERFAKNDSPFFGLVGKSSEGVLQLAEVSFVNAIDRHNSPMMT
jgi:hypothetical protein